MATDVIMPALGMAQETGQLVRWLKAEGDTVSAGDVIAEIQTDKATVELEARASGVLTSFVIHAGDEAPVGAVIAQITQPGEALGVAGVTASAGDAVSSGAVSSGGESSAAAPLEASPLAARIASEHGVDLRDVPAPGPRVQKADVLAYLETRNQTHNGRAAVAPGASATLAAARLAPASPKARRLALQRGVDLRLITGSGPEHAVLTSDVSAAAVAEPVAEPLAATSALSPIWRIMAERTTQSWREIPHFFLLREVNASRLIAWRETLNASQREAHQDAEAPGVTPVTPVTPGVTYTDLLAQAVAHTLQAHPRLNASWQAGGVTMHGEINIGLAVATSDGLVVPVIHRADQLSVREIAARRAELVKRAQAGKQRPDDLAGATFTISNLGMYGVDAFNAIVPAPQAAILAVGRIVERVVPLHGAPAIQPMLALSLSCDHRVVDGARGAQFLGALAELIEEPLALLG